MPDGVGYLVLLTNGLQMSSGAAATADSDYATIKTTLGATINPANCATLPNAPMQGACGFTASHLLVAANPALGPLALNPANVVVSFHFSTVATRDTLRALGLTIFNPAAPVPAIVVSPTAIPLNGINPALPAYASARFGTVTVPYYSYIPTAQAPGGISTDSAVLRTAWRAAAAPPAPLTDPANERNLTRFNPIPELRASKPIPLLVIMPNGAAGAAGVKPAAGWPVVIFEHGITRDRSDAFALAQAFAAQGWVIAAVDLPLHGITSTTSPLYQASNEQTFNLDLIVNASGASGPDGVIDPTGTHFINLPYPLASRDNLRQGVVNLLALTRALPALDLDGDTVGDIDPARIAFIGQSLGSIVGISFGAALPTPTNLPAPTASPLRVPTMVFSVPGGGVAELLRDSPTFGPRINAGLAAQGLLPGTTAVRAIFPRRAEHRRCRRPAQFRDGGRGTAVYLLPADGGWWRHHAGPARPGDPEFRHPATDRGDHEQWPGGRTAVPARGARHAGERRWLRQFRRRRPRFVAQPCGQRAGHGRNAGRVGRIHGGECGCAHSCGDHRSRRPHAGAGSALDCAPFERLEEWGHSSFRSKWGRPAAGTSPFARFAAKWMSPFFKRLSFRSIRLPTDKPQSFIARMRAKINRPGSWLSYDLANLVPGRKIDAEVLDELETRLLTADVGVDATQHILEELRRKVARKELDDVNALIAALTDAITAILLPSQKPLALTAKPFVLLVVGVNGSGKTTTIGKLARRFADARKHVVLAAGDTFRAAAIEQLGVWADRSGSDIIQQQAGADPGAVVFDAVQAAISRRADVVIIDTAGRLHSQSHLMDELKKVKRVIQRVEPSAPHEVLLVLDANQGQNALTQATQFHEAVGVTGLVLTKLDGTAKGGIVIAIARKLGLPIRFIGVGEQAEDFGEFDARAFASALVSGNSVAAG